MKAKYWLCKRKETFFSFDSTTGKRESLHTGDREAAKQIMRAKNDAATQPATGGTHMGFGDAGILCGKNGQQPVEAGACNQKSGLQFHPQ
jgi:hypothetical protein